METRKDFKELLESFNERNVEYIIVGAFALAWHGHPRYTGDLDIFVNPASDNAARVLSALDDFGFGSLGLKHTAGCSSGTHRYPDCHPQRKLECGMGRLRAGNLW
jgi:hypothetical protein